jgi:hypothetical protein
MQGRFRSIFLIAFIFLFCTCKQNEVRQIPVSDFFKTPEKSFFKISPDGKYISYLKPYKDKQNIYIRLLATGAEQMATNFTDYSVRDYSWTFNNQIVFTQDIIAVDEFRIYTLDVATLKVKSLVNLEKARIRILTATACSPM